MLDNIAGNLFDSSFHFIPSNSPSSQPPHKSNIQVWNAYFELSIEIVDFLRVRIVENFFVYR